MSIIGTVKAKSKEGAGLILIFKILGHEVRKFINTPIVENSDDFKSVCVLAHQDAMCLEYGSLVASGLIRSDFLIKQVEALSEKWLQDMEKIDES